MKYKMLFSDCASVELEICPPNECRVLTFFHGPVILTFNFKNHAVYRGRIDALLHSAFGPRHLGVIVLTILQTCMK